MNVKDAIKWRRSVRTFDGTPLSDDDTKRIYDYALTVDNPYGIPIRWVMLDAKKDKVYSPVVVGANSYITGVLPRRSHIEEAFGYSFERVVLFAASLSVGTVWMAGTIDRPAFEKAAGVTDGEAMPCVSPLGYPAEKISFREAIMRKGVRASNRLPFESLFFEGSFATPLTPEKAGDLAEAFEMTRLSPSAINKQPWRAVKVGDCVHFYEQRNKGLITSDGIDLQKIDLGIALCHFTSCLEADGRKYSFSLEDPGITPPQDTYYIATITVK